MWHSFQDATHKVRREVSLYVPVGESETLNFSYKVKSLVKLFDHLTVVIDGYTHSSTLTSGDSLLLGTHNRGRREGEKQYTRAHLSITDREEGGRVRDQRRHKC